MLLLEQTGRTWFSKYGYSLEDVDIVKRYWCSKKNTQTENLLVRWCTLYLGWNSPYLVGGQCTVRQDMRADDTYLLRVMSARDLHWNFFNIYFWTQFLSELFALSPSLLFHLLSWWGRDFVEFWLTALLSPLCFYWKVEPGGLCTLLHSTRSLLMEELSTIISIWHTESAPLNVFVQPGSGKLLFRSKDASDWNLVFHWL